VAPTAAQGTPFQKYRRPDTGAIMKRILLYIENIAGPQGFDSSCSVLDSAYGTYRNDVPDNASG
jgi:hypothetical protein